MGGNTHFGSRSEFLPGEGCDDTNIKYHRYGGCFVTYKKGVLLVLGALAFAGFVGYLVYHYIPCFHREDNEYNSADDFLTELNTAAKSASEKTKEISKISSNIIPSYYRLRIQPYLDETGPKNSSFEGHATIVFQIDGSPTKMIILNAKNLTISDFDVSVTYPSSSKLEPLRSASQIKEGDDNVTSESTNSSITSSAPAVNISSDDNPVVDDTTVSPTNTSVADSVASVDNTTAIANISTEATTASPVHEIVSEETKVSPQNTSTSPELPPETSTTIPTPLKEPSKDLPLPTSPVTTTTERPPNVVASDVTNIQIGRLRYDPIDETYRILLKLPMQKGVNYTLKIKYTGKLSEGLGGISKYSYTEGNETRWIAATYFKPNHARTAFPCFDAPKFKTTFEISVARKTSMIAVSNMPLKETTPIEHSGWVWDDFEQTPLMSTHQIAFAVFQFDAKKASSTVPNPLMNAWGRADTLNKATYTLDATPKILESYNKFFGFNYSLPKLDLVAIPNLPLTAIGHWGLIFFRENLMSVDHGSSNTDKKRLIETASRELARQWFGNLITVKSWNESWFIDTMCNYAQYIGMNTVDPSWNSIEKSFSFDMYDVLDYDSMNLLPQLHDYSIDSENIDSCHQKLLTKKGSLIIRTLNNTLTEPIFVKGVQKFIENWKFKCAEEDNLWDEMNSVLSDNSLPSGVTIKDIMKLWTTQEGYPIVSVIRNYEKESASLKQYRYTEKQLTSNNVWVLPLNYQSTTVKTDTKIWLVDTSPTIIEKITPNNDTWLLFNTGPSTSALCRVNYDLDNWKSLIGVLKTEPDTLSPSSRAQLLDDAFHLARNGLLNYSLTLELSMYLREHEQHSIPWAIALKNLDYLNVILSKTAYYGSFQDYVLKLLEQMYTNLDPITKHNNDNSFNLQKHILTWSCRFNYKPCIDWAYSQYMMWANFSDPDHVNQIDNDLRSVVYCVGVKMRGRSAWEFLWKRYENARENPSEVQALVTGMGCTTDTWLLIKYLQRALDEKSIENSIIMWESLTSDHAVNTAFSFLRNNWDKIIKTYSKSSFAFKRILQSILTRLSNKNDLDELIRFFSSRKSELKQFAQDIGSIIETIKQKLDWQKSYLEPLNQWIQINIAL